MATEERSTVIAGSPAAAVIVMAAILGVGLSALGFWRAWRAEVARRKGTQHFELLVDGAADHALYTLDAQGRVSHWNKGAERLKGYTSSDIEGRSFECFFTEEDRLC